jgi:hypothetical protein
MRVARGRIIASVVCLVVVSLPVRLVAQSDPAVGTWKLNPEKSRYTPGPVPKSNLITIVAVDTGLKVSGQGIDGAGKPTSINYTLTFDGKDRPVAGSPDYDSTSGKRINANTTEQTRKKEGKMVQTARREISADGTTMTITTRGRDASGHTINNIGIYERQ